MTETTGTTKALNILIVEDMPSEQAKARAAIAVAGHTAVVTASMGEAVSCLREGTVDGVVTDLMFTPDRGGDTQLAHYSNHQPAMGLLVVIAAMAAGKQVVICTSSDHHGLDAAWIHDCYISHLVAWEYENGKRGRDYYHILETKLPFGWVEGKDWPGAVSALARRIAAAE